MTTTSHGEQTVLSHLAAAAAREWRVPNAKAVAEGLAGALSRAQTYKALDALAKARMVTPKTTWRRAGIALTDLGRREAAALVAANAVRSGRAAPPPHPEEGQRPVPKGTLPLDRIHAGTRNPRREFDAETIAELADSIVQFGVLQNLIVRPLPAADERFELVAGERRWRALRLLAERGAIPADHPVPVRIVEMDDEQALLLAITENAQREDVHPLDEAEAFLALYRRTQSSGGDASRVSGRIAERVGKTRRWVEKRLALARRLSEPAAEAFRAGRLTLAQAQAISIAGPRMQERAVSMIETGARDWQTGDRIKSTIRREAVPLEHAFGFGRVEYEAAGGKIIEIDGAPHLDDRQLYLALAKKAVKAHARALAPKRAFVKIERWFPAWKYEAAGADVPDAETGCILIAPTQGDSRTCVHDRLVAKKPVDAAGTACADSEPEWTWKHCRLARDLKTEALQTALLDRPALALGVLVTALVRIDTDDSTQALALPPEDLASAMPQRGAAVALGDGLCAILGPEHLWTSEHVHESIAPYDVLGARHYPCLRAGVEPDAIVALAGYFRDRIDAAAFAALAPLACAGAMMIQLPTCRDPSTDPDDMLAWALAEACGFPEPDPEPLLEAYGEIASRARRLALAEASGIPQTRLDDLRTALEHDIGIATCGYANWLREHATRPIAPPELAWRSPAAEPDEAESAGSAAAGDPRKREHHDR